MARRSEQDDPVLSIVISTLGVDHHIPEIVSSLDADPCADRVELIVVDQSTGMQVASRLIAEPPARLALHTTTSERGVSRGRNAGLRLATGSWVGFPDDTALYPAGMLSELLEAFAATDGQGVSAQLVTPDGAPAQLRWLRRPGPVTRDNWHRTSIESTLFLRRATVEAAGGFDDHIGTGSGTAFGAGEGTDLMLRVLAQGGTICYLPHLHVIHEDPRTNMPADYAEKMRRYGRGQGYILRVHRLPLAMLVTGPAKKLVSASVHFVRGDRRRATAQLAYAQGVLEGWLKARGHISKGSL